MLPRPLISWGGEYPAPIFLTLPLASQEGPHQPGDPRALKGVKTALKARSLSAIVQQCSCLLTPWHPAFGSQQRPRAEGAEGVHGWHPG